MNRSKAALYLSLLTLLMAPVAANAAKIDWVTKGDGAWFVAKNWTNGQVPSIKDDALDDITATAIIQDDSAKSITVKTLTLTNSTLKLAGSFKANDGIALDKGALQVGVGGAGGTIHHTAITGSGSLFFSKSILSAFDHVTFNGGEPTPNDIDINNTAGGTVTIKGGLKNFGTFSMSNGSSIVFDGDQTAQETFKLSGISTFGLSDGTALIFSNAYIKLVNKAAAVSTTIGNTSKHPTRPTKIVFDGALIGPDERTSDNATSMIITADDIVSKNILRIDGSEQSTYAITTTKFTNQAQGKMSLVNRDDPPITINANSFSNVGAIVAEGPLNIYTEKFTNSGMFAVDGGKARAVVNPLNGKGSAAVNSGKLDIGGKASLSFLNGYTQKGKDAVTTVDGKLNIQNAAGVRETGRLEGGEVNGVGTINGNLKVVDGIVKPGKADPPGILTINGGYDQEAGGSLAIQIYRGASGPVACDGVGCYSRLVVTHGVTLDGGALDVSLGSALQAGDLFGIVDNLRDTAVDGTFAGLAPNDTLTEDYGGRAYILQISYDGDILSPTDVTFSGGNDIVLQVLSSTTVPEPAPWMFMLVGVGAIGALQRRRIERRWQVDDAASD